MRIGRRWMLAICAAALVAGFTSLPIQAQTAAPPATPAVTATSAPTPAAPQQAYTLPPEKLAKAIALSRVRITLGIAEALWGIVFLWLLLALRAWAAIERWAQRASPAAAGCRGSCFSPHSSSSPCSPACRLTPLRITLSVPTESACRRGAVGWAIRPRHWD